MDKQKGSLVLNVDIPVRWYDMDAFGHVNNSVFFTYFEQARVLWWAEITPPGVSFAETGPVIINASCTFFKAITYPDNVTVKLFVGPAGNSSYECFYEIYSQAQPDVLYAEGATKVVWVDRTAERSVPLPDYIRHYLPTK
jgi:acyl-CoA thioester hydrolase